VLDQDAHEALERAEDRAVVMPGRLACPSLSMYSSPKRSGCWKSTWMAPPASDVPSAACTRRRFFGP